MAESKEEKNGQVVTERNLSAASLRIDTDIDETDNLNLVSGSIICAFHGADSVNLASRCICNRQSYVETILCSALHNLW